MIQAIETWYGGYRFRSRLEARWAVFFDHLGIEWEYEPQGYVANTRITLESPRDDPSELTEIPYLPDFWLPYLGLFAEVKGSLTSDECVRLLNIAGSLSSPEGGCGGGRDLVVLGPIPRDPHTRSLRLHLHKGDLVAALFDPTSRRGNRCGYNERLIIASDVGGINIFENSWAYRVTGKPDDFDRNAERTGEFLLRGRTARRPGRKYQGALDAARSARFEHGQRG